jgi:hypothetical protein
MNRPQRAVYKHRGHAARVHSWHVADPAMKPVTVTSDGAGIYPPSQHIPIAKPPAIHATDVSTVAHSRPLGCNPATRSRCKLLAAHSCKNAPCGSCS